MQKTETAIASILSSFTASQQQETPYRHWFVSKCLPTDTVDGILKLPWTSPNWTQNGGKREIHNAARTYFDRENQKKHDVCHEVASAFQDPRVTSKIQDSFETNLKDCYLRIEYAQDTDGFWLEPHSDLGVKPFTMLLYLSKERGHKSLGTDIYDKQKKWFSRSPFESNVAMVFVPSDNTFHGFERRKFSGIRKSIIINYVTNAWRERKQLAFPNDPINA